MRVNSTPLPAKLAQLSLWEPIKTAEPGQREYPCLTCGRAVLRWPSMVRERVYCSQACFKEAPKRGQYVACQNCSKQVWRDPVNIRDTNFCSYTCRGKWHQRTRVTRSCKQCGKDFTLPPSLMIETRVCCSRRCGNLAKMRQTEVQCRRCGTAVIKKHCQIKGKHGSFCTTTCWYEWSKENIGPDFFKVLRRRIKNDVGDRIRKSVKAGKSAATEAIIGYPITDLIAHIEAQFTDGMTWDNWGIKGWHIDHIRPVSSFDMQTIHDPAVKECWALSNLQPLWAEDNMRKRAKWFDGATETL